MAYIPTIDDVGALLRARTVNSHGVEVGTFTAETRPTDLQVQRIIDLAVGDVRALLGTDLPEAVHGSVASLAATRAAMKVELSFYPEQIAAGNSVYPQLAEEWRTEGKAVAKAVMEEAGGGKAGSVDDATLPSYFFPEDAGGMIGWETRW